MSEIAQLFESALRQNRASLLRKAAINTVAKMPHSTRLRDLLNSDAGEAIRELTLRDLSEALGDKVPIESKRESSKKARTVVPANAGARESAGNESREERIYRQILSAITGEAMTIGQLSKLLSLEIDELRGYLNWMKKMGKVNSAGRARATRYQAVR